MKRGGRESALRSATASSESGPPCKALSHSLQSQSCFNHTRTRCTENAVCLIREAIWGTTGSVCLARCVRSSIRTTETQTACNSLAFTLREVACHHISMNRGGTKKCRVRLLASRTLGNEGPIHDTDQKLGVAENVCLYIQKAPKLIFITACLSRFFFFFPFGTLFRVKNSSNQIVPASVTTIRTLHDYVSCVQLDKRLPLVHNKNPPKVNNSCK